MICSDLRDTLPFLISVYIKLSFLNVDTMDVLLFLSLLLNDQNGALLFFLNDPHSKTGAVEY